MKISELLSIPILKGMNIIAGELGKNREVETVNMMDAPDIIHFLKPNELLVTTAYHLKDNPNLLTVLVRNMAENRCSGLGIKTKRFLKEIPAEAINIANELAFPIIELPMELSLGEIVNGTLGAILDKRSNELRYALETHKQFTNLIISGKGIQKLLENLAEMIGYPIILFDRYLKQISPSQPHLDILEVMVNLQENGYSFLARKTYFCSFSILSSKQIYSVFPILISGKNFGFLTIPGEIKQGDTLSVLTIEQAINVIAFAFMQDQAVKQYERRIRNEFFLNFINGIFTSPEEVINRAKDFSFENNQKYICAVGKLDEVGSSNLLSHYQKSDLLFEFLEEELYDSPHPVHLFSHGGMCILLYKVSDGFRENIHFTESILKQLQNKITGYFGNTVSFGISTICHNFLDVKNAFKEALDAYQEVKILNRLGYIQAYQTKDVMELLRTIPKDDLANFYSYAMQGFSEMECAEEETLLQTLSVYLENHCQISETAKILFIHRNTVVYRLEKCEELLGRSLRDSETTLQIRIALRIRKLLNL